MSLLYKFVSIVLLILLSGLVATGFVAWHQLDRLAENQVQQQAKLMMRAASQRETIRTTTSRNS